MDRKLAVTLLGAMLSSSAQAATLFSPTDTTVNFIEFFGGGAALLGIFDDSDPGSILPFRRVAIR